METTKITAITQSKNFIFSFFIFPIDFSLSRKSLKKVIPKLLRHLFYELRLKLKMLFKLPSKLSVMFINHALLCGLGISDESLEWLINAARKAGALGAKLTSAGGGGCMIALAENERLKQVLEAIQRAGGSPFIARKTDEGVRIEGF